MIQTPRSDIYVVMLGIALGAILLGCLLLMLVLNRYEWKTKVSVLGSSSPGLVAAVEQPVGSPIALS
jgi:hypothetical protein